MVNRSIVRVLLRGILWGLAGALLGSLIFGLIASPLVIWEVGKISLSYTSAKWDSPAEMISYFLRSTDGVLEWIVAWLYWSLLTGGIGVAVALIPGVLGGVFLSLIIYSSAIPLLWWKKTKPVHGGVVGALVGTFMGILVATPLLILYNATNLVGYLVLGFVAFLITVICSIFVGWRLALGCKPDLANDEA